MYKPRNHVDVLLIRSGSEWKHGSDDIVLSRVLFRSSVGCATKRVFRGLS